MDVEHASADDVCVLGGQVENRLHSTLANNGACLKMVEVMAVTPVKLQGHGNHRAYNGGRVANEGDKDSGKYFMWQTGDAH